MTFYLLLQTLYINPLSPNLTKWSNTLKHFANELFECLTNFVGLALKGLIWINTNAQMQVSTCNSSYFSRSMHPPLITGSKYSHIVVKRQKLK